MDNLVFSSFSDPTVPKKKYCKRKSEDDDLIGAQNDIKACVLSFEKEIKELDAQIYELVSDNYRNHLLIKELQNKSQILQIHNQS